jgi:phosphoserine phosphatase
MCSRPAGFALVLSLAACAVFPREQTDDPLPSWRDGATKRAILDFVKQVTTKGGPDYVPPAERIATFDNDGTLWAEKPLYFQVAFVFERARQMAKSDSTLKDKQPYKAILQNDRAFLSKLGVEDLFSTLLATHANMTQQEFDDLARQWLAEARHPRYHRHYTEVVYQPMLELLRHLRAHGFQTWICSAGGIDFMRLFSQEVYGIPPEQVIGSSLKKRFEVTDQGPVLHREAQIALANDKAAKPGSIQQHIGRRPILAAGNSDGDLQMLQYTDDGDGPTLMLLVHHDDAEREYDYDKGTENALAEARRRGWTVVSIQKDFRRVFPFENR